MLVIAESVVTVEMLVPLLIETVVKFKRVVTVEK